MYAGFVLMVIWLGIYFSIKGELLSAFNLDRNLRPKEPMLSGNTLSSLSLKKFRDQFKNSYDDHSLDE